MDAGHYRMSDGRMVRRSENSEADDLANEAIDEGGWSGMLDKEVWCCLP